MTTKRPLPVVVLALAVVLAAGGCGAQTFPKAVAPTPSTIVDGAKPPRARLLAAVQRVTDAKTARISLDAKLSAAGRTVDENATGVVDLARRRAQLTVESSGAVESRTEVRVIDGTMYVEDQLGWSSVPALSALGTGLPDPTSYLDYLRGVAADVRVAGTAGVRGVYTTRYSATIDLARALTDALGPVQRSEVLAVVGILGRLKIPTSVWIDELGRLRKLQMSIDIGAIATKLGAPARTHATLDETMELYDFGVAVKVVAPASSKDVRSRALDLTTESDLRNALTAEKTYYTDQMRYTADTSMLKEIEPSLDWGGKLAVVVGNGADSGSVVCLSERSKSGTTFTLADVADGADAGTYFSTSACPAVVTDTSFSTFGSHW